MNSFSSSFTQASSWLGAFILAAGLAALSAQLDHPTLSLLTLTLMWVTLAHCWNILGGYAGYVDLGQAALVGVGAYVAGLLTTRLPVTPVQILIAAIFIGILLAIIIGWTILRLSGALFTLATLAILALLREVARVLIVPNDIFFLPMSDVYGLMVALFTLALLLSIWAFRSPFGLMLRALREDETGAAARGINTMTIKLVGFTLVGGITAVVGAARTFWQGIVTPDIAFHDDLLALVIVITLIGGIGRPWGPVIGGVLLFAVQSVIPAHQVQILLLLTGLVILAVLFFFPSGILGLLESRGLLVRRDSRDSDDAPQPLSQERIGELLISNSTVSGVVLEGREITHDFGGLRAVNKVSFWIRHGEIIGLLGPNGAGKSTLFDCISGILNPTGGEIILNGQDITHLNTWRVNRYGLARTFERARLFEGLTVHENMLLARKWRNKTAWLFGAPHEIHRRADELLMLLGIGHTTQRLVHDLSATEQRLLEIGMALMSEPSIILLDEITSGIPLTTADELKTTIRRLNHDFGLTFFIIEHNMNFAVDLCDRVYVLDHGVVVAEGTPQDMLHEPAVADAYFGHE